MMIQESKGQPSIIMGQEQQEAMVEEGNCKVAGQQGLTWHSRKLSWWSSAVDLSSTLLSKMDQVPASLVGFGLPWHAGAKGDEPKPLQLSQEFVEKKQLVESPESRNEIAKPALEQIAKPALDCEQATVEDSPKGETAEEDLGEETRLTPRGVESRRRTKRMPVDLTPAGPKQEDDDADAPIRSKKLSAVGREILLGDGHGTTKVYHEEMRRLRRHRKQLSEAAVWQVEHAGVRSSRSWSRLDDMIKSNPPHALPAPPSECDRISETRTEESLPNRDLKPTRLCEDAVGSSRVTLEAPNTRRRSSPSLPPSPRFRKESRASKFFRTLGISSHAEGDIVVSKKLTKQKGLQVVNNLIVSQHQKFAKSLEPQKLGITNGVRNHQEGKNSSMEHSCKKSWLFKWIRGSPKPAVQSKHAVALAQRGEAPPQVCSEPKSTRHKRASSWSCASHASTAAVNPLRRSRIHQVDNDAAENMVESGVECDDREAFQDCHGSFERPESFRRQESFRGQESFRKGEVFEDCHGSFRSVTSCASFRSAASLDEMEWGPPPPDQSLTIGDVAALCNSSLKFVFKCREIQHFNKFLRSQKKRLLTAHDNTDCFNVILSGPHSEASAMVAALAYAWFLDSTVPKDTGKTWHAVALIDIPRHQMHKHKDAAWLFDTCGIDPAALLFADEMQLSSLVEAGRIKISTIGQDVLVTKNEVGSVCTLLAEKLLAEAQCVLEPRYMKTLLLAGVLLDTEDLDFASTRDTEITNALLVGSGSLGRNGFFDQLRDVEDDDQVAKLITRSYGDAKQLSSRKISSSAVQATTQQEADQEQSDKDSLFTQSQDQTSTSEAGTSSSLDEDSPRSKHHRSSFKFPKRPSRSAPGKSHQLQSLSGIGCKEDATAVAHIRKATATQIVNSSCGTRSSNLPRVRQKLFLYQA